MSYLLCVTVTGTTKTSEVEQKTKQEFQNKIFYLSDETGLEKAGSFKCCPLSASLSNALTCQQ